MKNSFNLTAFEKMVQHYKNDNEALEMIYDVLCSFEEYHTKIINMEAKIMIYSGALDSNEYQKMVTELDKNRTIQHNSVLTGVNILNRLAEQVGLDPVYDGVVSKDRPFRREVANAVLDYLQSIIEKRR